METKEERMKAMDQLVRFADNVDTGVQIIFEGTLERSFDGVNWEKVYDVAADGLYTISMNREMILYRTVVE